MKRFRTVIRFLLLAVLLAGCANIGNPDGGRYDEEPPVVVRSSPANGAVNSHSKKINIRFDEYIKLENASEKVVISPPQKQTPNVAAEGKSVKITFYDSLQANTTYTIDFADAIVDNNESNPMGQYTFSFSTGPEIDTMEVSGTVLAAENLEPVKGISVGLYSADSVWNDSVFRTSPFLRVGRTNGSGHFSVKGVKPGRYRVFALQDMDGDSRFSQKSEQIAWDTTTIETSQRPDLRPDTIWIDSTHIDRIRMIPYIHYFPDNLVLRSFLENGQDQHFLKSERKDPYSFTLYFTAPQDSLPLIEGIGFDANKALIAEPSAKNDTIVYWIADTLVAHADTLKFNMTYPDTDSTGTAVPYTELMELSPKTTHAKIEKERQKQMEEWQKKQEKEQKKRQKRGKPDDMKPEDNPFETTFLKMTLRPSTTLAPNQNLTVEFNEPIAKFDSTRVHFDLKVDSLWYPAPYLFLPVEGNRRKYTLYAEWQQKSTYRLTIDSLAFESVLGHPNRTQKNDLRIKSEDDFGSIFVHLVGQDTACYVQLLSASDKVQATLKAENGRADFFYLKPQDYYIRMFIDRNGNGEWDTGDYNQQIQPEEVFYFPKPIPLKARFDIEQSWNYRSISLEKQKPKAITKQKADKEKTIKSRNAEREANKNK